MPVEAVAPALTVVVAVADRRLLALAVDAELVTIAVVALAAVRVVLGQRRADVADAGLVVGAVRRTAALLRPRIDDRGVHDRIAATLVVASQKRGHGSGHENPMGALQAHDFPPKPSRAHAEYRHDRPIGARRVG